MYPLFMVVQIALNVTQPFFVKINTKQLPWKKVAPKYALLL
jgi:hypothetical protein